MDDFWPSLLPWVRAHGSGVVFAALALESAALVGMIVPGLAVLTAAGILVGTGDLAPWPTAAAAVSGTLLGDSVSYLAGRFGVRSNRWLRARLDRQAEVRQFVFEAPAWRYCFFHFPAYLRAVFPLALGSLRYPVARWVLIDAIGAVLFCGTFLTVGLVIGRLSVGIGGALRWSGAIALVGSVLFGWWLLRSALRLLEQRRAGRSPERAGGTQGPGQDEQR